MSHKNLARLIAVVLFFVIMFFVRQIAHFVTDLGVLPWLLMMAGIFWIGIRIENKDRQACGETPYSWLDAKLDFRETLPIAAFWGIAFIAVYILTRFI